MRLFFFTVISLLVFFSCKDECNNDCLNDSICVTGICECLEGYEGEFCEMEIAEKFIGEIRNSDDGLLFVDLSFNLTNGSLGLFQFPITLTAEISESNKLTIPEKSFFTQNNLLLIRATGILEANTLELDMYLAIQGVSLENCLFSLERN